MHGVRRGTRPVGHVSAEAEQIAREQASLARRALTLRRSRDYSEEAMATVTRAITANPDEYSLWAFRRENLLRKVAGGDCADDAFTAAWQAELDLSFSALKRHPKAYPAWQHRLWLLSSPIISKALPATVLEKALGSEFAMSGVLLSRDGRNFHGWAHRMRVRAVAPNVPGSSPQDEASFVTDKINSDFANYSAWHHRSVILPTLNRDCASAEDVGEERVEDFVAGELEFVRQAFYTEPDVQSAWFYHRWLLCGAPARGSSAVMCDSLLNEELAACRELLEIEPEARLALHAEADLLSRLKKHIEAVRVYERLIVLDPMRRGFYREKIVKAMASSD